MEMSGDIQKIIMEYDPLKPDLTKISYVDKGLWDKETTPKFYKQDNEQYVSQTFIEGIIIIMMLM